MESVIKKFLNKHKYLPLFLVVFAACVVYLISSTRSALWYDEAIEYFFSKYLTGETPGAPGLTNMYQRILSTYQPPLYNILMHLWLSVFDFGDFSFRLPGILVTLIGGVGIYFCLKELCGRKWATLGTLIYLFCPGIAYYALECGEYNLMLCFLSWTMFFFVRTLKGGSKSVYGFFLFSCLSVYSQYGAALLVLVLYGVLAVKCLRSRETRGKFLLCTGVIALAAVLPLIVFFLIPQMLHQGTAAVSHNPFFASNPIWEFVRGLYLIIHRIFKDNYVLTMGSGFFRGALGTCFCLLSLFALLFTLYAVWKKDNFARVLFVCCCILYLIYFILVACSFYGYNHEQGTNNLGYRYVLFFAPVLVVTLVYGCSVFFEKAHMTFRTVIGRILLIAVAFSCGVQTYALSVGWEKDDIRGATEEWYMQDRGDTVTLVHEWSDANFQYYLRHSEAYTDALQANIRTAGAWIREPDEEQMREELNKMGIFQLDSLFYVGPQDESTRVFCEIMRNEKYQVTVLYDHCSMLAYLSK